MLHFSFKRNICKVYVEFCEKNKRCNQPDFSFLVTTRHSSPLFQGEFKSFFMSSG